MKIFSILNKIKKKISLYFTSEVDATFLDDLLDISSLNLEKKKRIIKNTYFMYPSELSKCLKLSYQKYIDNTLITGLSPSTKAGNIIDFGIEYAIKKLQSKNKKMFLIYKFPIRYIKKIRDDKIVIAGSADFVSKNAVIEIKSTMDKSLAPQESDMYQLGFYTKVLSEEFNKEFNAYLIYIYRNMFLKKIYELGKEDINRGFNIILNRALLLYSALKNKIKLEGEAGPWCSGCPMLKNCEIGHEYVKNVLKKDVDFVSKMATRDKTNTIEAYKKVLKKLPF
ncbi:MAG: hypothetical protein QXI77_00215 [Nanopusillaceae archaeon]